MADRQRIAYVAVWPGQPGHDDDICGVTLKKEKADAFPEIIHEFVIDDPEIFPEAAEQKGGTLKERAVLGEPLTLQEWTELVRNDPDFLKIIIGQ